MSTFGVAIRTFSQPASGRVRNSTDEARDKSGRDGGDGLDPDRNAVHVSHAGQPLEIVGLRGGEQVDVGTAGRVRGLPPGPVTPAVGYRDGSGRYLVGDERLGLDLTVWGRDSDLVAIF